MAEVLQRLRKEHADQAILLDVLDRQLAIFMTGDVPDFKVVRGVLDYFLSYPDLYHHTKEDLIFHRLRVRAPEHAENLEALLAAHDELAQLTRRFTRAAVDQMLRGGELPRQWFASLAREFVDSNRRHMAMEEEKFFPLALRTLGKEDWDEIDAQVMDQDDPLFGGDVDARFQALHESIVELQRTGGDTAL